MLDEALRKLPKEVRVFNLAVTLTQDPDSCGPDLSQELKIATDDAGGGPYVVLETDRWAIDNVDDLRALADLVAAMLAHSERVED